MSIQTAHRLCPELIVVGGDREEYKRVSQQVHEIFQSYTDEIEPLSIDEAFLDVTNNKKGIEMAVDIAREIRQRIADELHLTASAGISYCKFLAKVASDYRKPNGMTVIHPDKALDFIADLPIEKFWGIGSKTAARMHSMGILQATICVKFRKPIWWKCLARWAQYTIISRWALMCARWKPTACANR